jgi:FdhD protein
MDCNLNSEALKIKVLKVNETDNQIAEEEVVIEKALTIYLNDQEFVTMICSPGQEQELVTGFLCSEGIIAGPGELNKLSVDKRDGLVWVETNGKNSLSENLFQKRYLTSCCGKGRISFYFANDARITPKNTSPLRITSDKIIAYLNLLEEKSELFRRTGGVHGGAIAADGILQYCALDIGRHNVLDKLYGQALRDRVNLEEKIIVFSGRISSEILLKTAKMRCPILVGVSAPTNLALDLAEELGITVIGFARKERMNIYTYPERIIISPTRVR